MTMTVQPVYSFCEPVSATTLSREHIRRVGPEGVKPGGGIPATPGTALCGASVAHGWDLPDTEVSEPTIASGLDAHVNPTCRSCAETWRAETSTTTAPTPTRSPR